MRGTSDKFGYFLPGFQGYCVLVTIIHVRFGIGYYFSGSDLGSKKMGFTPGFRFLGSGTHHYAVHTLYYRLEFIKNSLGQVLSAIAPMSQGATYSESYWAMMWATIRDCRPAGKKRLDLFSGITF